MVDNPSKTKIADWQFNWKKAIKTTACTVK